MKSFEYLNNEVTKTSKKVWLSEQEDFFSDEWFNSLTSKDLPKILSPSILHTLQTNSETKIHKMPSALKSSSEGRTQVRKEAEVPDFEVNQSHWKESEDEDLPFNILLRKDNYKLNINKDEQEQKKKWVESKIKQVKLKSRNSKEPFNFWKTGSVNPSIIRIKNKDKNAVVRLNNIHNFSQLKIKDINTLHTQRNNIVESVQPDFKPKPDNQNKYEHPFSEFIKNSEKSKNSEEMFKKIFKKNLKRKTSFKLLGLGGFGVNTNQSNIIKENEKAIKNSWLQSPTSLHLNKNDI